MWTTNEKDVFDYRGLASGRTIRTTFVLFALAATLFLGVRFFNGSTTRTVTKGFSPDRVHQLVLKKNHRGTFDVFVRRYYVSGVIWQDRLIYIGGRRKISKVKWRDNDTVRLNDYVLYIHNEPAVGD